MTEPEMLDIQIYLDQIRQTESIEELEGIASQAKELREQMGRVYEAIDLEVAKQASKLEPYGGVTRIAKPLGYTRSSLYQKLQIAEQYGDLLKDFPRLTRIHLAMLHGYKGMDKKLARHFLEIADNGDNRGGSLSVKQLAREVKKELGLPDKVHECPDPNCKKVHQIGEQHND